MIPTSYLTEWSTHAPWPDQRQIEQDLIICRALCDLFNSDPLKGKVAFRGGTAIHKLLLKQPLRYSEDIDLVQIQAGPIGEIVDAIRNALSWLGNCSRAQVEHSMHLVFKFNPEVDSGSTLKLKVEINTRDHQPLFGIKHYAFGVDSSWHSATASIASFEPEEIFGTKLRALLQRHKNRDLFDLNVGLSQLAMDCDKMIHCFEHYLALQKTSLSRAKAEEIMLKKLNRSLTEDIVPLLPSNVDFTDDNAISAFGKVWTQLIARIQGEPWKLSDSVIQEIQEMKIPTLLRNDTK